TGGAATVADIVVTDTLDEDIDLSTLVLGPVSHSLVCSTHIDYAKAVLTWTFTSIALPDNNTPPEGEGFVCYGARTYQPILNETEITNRAAVKFDSDPWELCPEYEPLLRTIDKQAPVSEVNSLPSLVIGDTVTVSWTRSDYTGSGIDKVEIYVSEDSGPYSLWYTAASWETSEQFQGDFDKCYEFYSVATDNVGNIEGVPGSADASTCLLLGYLYLAGDANMEVGTWPPRVIGSDVTYLVNYFRMMAPGCELAGFYASADANGDCLVIGSDVTFLVNYFRQLVSPVRYCVDYRPAWMVENDAPEDPPEGWPDCGSEAAGVITPPLE
ncbi:MAG: hypothetical protein GY839_19270, partial [candidate division Zixibacteria bacterium]|nr:hypothetical protein [candidate division Zixibacteria bacterium]